jgi:hypothetical protein
LQYKLFKQRIDVWDYWWGINEMETDKKRQIEFD